MTACSLELELVTGRCGKAECQCQDCSWREIWEAVPCIFPAEWAPSLKKIDARHF